MNLYLVGGLIVAALVAGWGWWRYAALRRRLGEYARSLREAPLGSLPAAPGEVEEIASAIAALGERFEQQISTLTGQHDRLAAVMDQMTDGVLMADASGQIRFANPAARRLFASPNAVGRTVTEVVRQHQLVEAWRRCQERREIQTESLEVPSLRQYLQLVVVPDRHGGGSLLFVQDLTRLRKLETVRRDFISNISHELRTPLASLKALTETLQGGALADEEAGPWFLERISTEVDALAQMAQELLDLSRIESGQVALHLSSWQPKELLEAAAQRMQMQAERAEVSIQVECQSDLPDVRADRDRLEQALVNLIHNAIKFSRPRGEVLLSAAMAGAEGHDGAAGPLVRFAVQDHGVGIPAEHAGRIFERFYRVDRARSGSGTGLGLSITRHVIEAHHGKIWVETTEGKGSTFYFTIPISKKLTIHGRSSTET